MKSFRSRKITLWLLDIGMVKLEEWEGMRWKLFPTKEGEEIGIVLEMWENYGVKSPVVYFTEEAQRFIIDNFDAVMDTKIQRKKVYDEPSDDSGGDKDVLEDADDEDNE